MRLLLVLPPLPRPNLTPYVGQSSLAAFALRLGIDTRCADLSALAPEQLERFVEELAHDWTPDVIGVSLFTQNALEGYALVERLRRLGARLLAGGPHATARPAEALAHGFDTVVGGEGEAALALLARGELGGGALNVERWHELDELPFPHRAARCFEHPWGGAHALRVVNDVLSSRGCPGKCSFCANFGTGRIHRFRGNDSIISQMHELVQFTSSRHFNFLDDAFSAHRPRTMALCRRLRDSAEGFSFAANVPPWSLRPADFETLAAAGCRAVSIGVESGDQGVLRRVGRALSLERVLEVVQAAHAAGLQVMTNWMFGFPDESEQELEATLTLMSRFAPFSTYMNPAGVLIPYPGTELYESFQQRYGFGEWWLDPSRRPAAPTDGERDPALELDFFHYSATRRALIEQALSFKAQHNRESLVRQRALGAGRVAQLPTRTD